MTQSKRNRFTANAKRGSEPTTAVILAATAGRRMIGHGLRNLLPYQNKCVIDYQINSIRTVYPNANVIVVGGFQHKQLHEYVSSMQDVTVLYNPNFKDSMSTLSLYIALLTINYHNVLFMNGDIICSPSAIPQDETTAFTVDTRNKIGVDEVGVNIASGRVVNLAFGLEYRWGQIGYITADHMATLRRVCSKYDHPLFVALNSFCGMVNVAHHENAKSVLFEIDSIRDLP